MQTQTVDILKKLSKTDKKVARAMYKFMNEGIGKLSTRQNKEFKFLVSQTRASEAEISMSIANLLNNNILVIRNYNESEGLKQDSFAINAYYEWVFKPGIL